MHRFSVHFSVRFWKSTEIWTNTEILCRVDTLIPSSCSGSCSTLGVALNQGTWTLQKKQDLLNGPLTRQWGMPGKYSPERDQKDCQIPECNGWAGPGTGPQLVNIERALVLTDLAFSTNTVVTDSFKSSHSSFSKYLYFQTVRSRDLKFLENITSSICHISHVT